MTDLETQIRGLVAHYPSKETWWIADVAVCSERTVQRVKKKMREEQGYETERRINKELYGEEADETDNQELIAACSTHQTALDTQVGGDHYKKLKIQPVEYIHANNIGFFEGNVIKYVTRWRDKGGVKDLEKAIHNIQLLIELEGGWDE